MFSCAKHFEWLFLVFVGFFINIKNISTGPHYLILKTTAINFTNKL